MLHFLKVKTEVEGLPLDCPDAFHRIEINL